MRGNIIKILIKRINRWKMEGRSKLSIQKLQQQLDEQIEKNRM